MPSFEIDVSVNDFLDELDKYEIEDLIERAQRRIGKLPALATPAAPPPALDDASLAQELRSAFYARNPDRFEALLSHLDRAPVIPNPAAKTAADFVMRSTH